MPTHDFSLEDWWNKSTLNRDKAICRCFTEVMINVLWNVWNEQNRRTLNETSLAMLDIKYLVENINQSRLTLKPEMLLTSFISSIFFAIM